MTLYAVSVDPPSASRALKEKLKSRFIFLSDPDGQLLDALGIRHRNLELPGKPEPQDVAFPTAVLVDEQGIVRWTYQSDTYRRRAEPEAIFAAIKAMNGSPAG